MFAVSEIILCSVIFVLHFMSLISALSHTLNKIFDNFDRVICTLQEHEATDMKKPMQW